MSSSSAFSPDHHHQDQLCYLQCKFCETILAVSVPCSSLLTTVTVRCGHCTNLLSVNMRLHLLPLPLSAATANSFFSPHNIIMEEIRNAPCNLFIDQSLPDPFGSVGVDELLKPSVVNRPPEKRQRVPSAYNRFIKEEIQRIKAGNPDISHREAFSAAAKNWAHFPHIHFGLMPDQPLRKANVCQQEGGDILTAGTVSISPS